MKTKMLLSALFMLAPAAAFAHGGHPEAGSHHAFAHVLWFAIPALLVGGYALRQILRRQQ